MWVSIDVVYTAFGMRPKTLVKVMEAFGYDNCTFGRPASGYRNLSWPTYCGKATLNLILYKSEPDIEKTIYLANALGSQLAKKGLPARHTVDPRILQITSVNQVRYCGLYNYLPGRTIPWEAYNMNHLKLLGKTMSDMHACLKDMSIEAPSVVEIHIQLVSRMEAYFANEGVQKAMNKKLGFHDFSQVFTSFHGLLGESKHLPNQQMLHMDFVRGNVLFAGEANDLHISGILDFEKAAYGSPLYDIARTLAFLLVDCKYKSEDKIRKYLLKSGYHKRGQQDLQLLTIDGKPVLEGLIDLFLVYDLYKFMRHSPYESLNQNEHYIRTRNLLLDRGIITYVV